MLRRRKVVMGLLPRVFLGHTPSRPWQYRWCAHEVLGCRTYFDVIQTPARHDSQRHDWVQLKSVYQLLCCRSHFDDDNAWRFPESAFISYQSGYLSRKPRQETLSLHRSVLSHV
ncbi:hypothetical protein GY45DRAFT_248318 [Cubamyces sp. BRFM 1775]|nr:hypothetical protein GY45DRAFT_248318 [Cubamyces sp. BRFM 1775]